MQNVPQTSVAEAGKIEFAKTNSGSSNDMSADLFGAFLAHEMDQESFAPAPDLETFVNADSVAPSREEPKFAPESVRTENAPAVPPAVRTVAEKIRSAKTAKAENEKTGNEKAGNEKAGDKAENLEPDSRPAVFRSGDAQDKPQAGNKTDKTDKQQAKATETEGKAMKAPKAEVDMDDMRDLLVSLEDLEGMKKQLLQYGLTEDDVAQLVEQAESVQGLTWGKLVAFISKKMDVLERNLEFTPEQKKQLMTFFQKLGISAADSEGMVAELAEGSLDKVLATLDRHIKALDQEQLMDLDLNKAKAFMEELRKLKADSQGRELGLVRTVSQAMKKAVSKIKAQLVAQEQTEAKAEDGQAGRTDELPQPKVNTKVADAARLVEGKTAEQTAATAAENAERILKVLAPTDQAKAALNQVSEKAAESLKLGGNDKPADHFMGQEQQPKNEQDAWSDFMGKMRQEPEHLGRTAKTMTTTEALSAKEAMTEALGQARQNFNATLDKLDAPKVMRQVQDGILRNLGQGRKQITLQLEPAHLGKLSIVLSSNKGGEVQATIRPDNHESAKLIAENLDSIKQYMENQGVKVSKLEVQTQLSQYNNNDWYGEAGHNQAREQEAQSRMFNRWRTLKDSGEAAPASVQDTVDAVRQAMTGGAGLHVVA